jgi:hypothetical protein
MSLENGQIRPLEFCGLRSITAPVWSAFVTPVSETCAVRQDNEICEELLLILGEADSDIRANDETVLS